MTADDAERALLAERILAEQEERRRLAELLHDGPVQHLSAIAQMLDAGLASLREGDSERAGDAVTRGLALARSRLEISARSATTSSRKCSGSWALRPPGALARRLAARHDVEIDLDVDDAATLGENAQTALYQILREATDQAVRRGAPTRIEISVRATPAGGVELVVADDGPPERRSTVLEALAERAATLNARFSSEVRYPRGSTVRVDVPPSAARR